MTKIIFALPLVLGACSMSPSADVIKALAADQNSICIKETSVWVNISVDRNHGCEAASSPVVVVSSGVGPSHVEVIRP